MKPDARKRCEYTETIAGVARATTLATAEESKERLVALGSVIAKLQLVDPNLGISNAFGNYPNGQDEFSSARRHRRFAIQQAEFPVLSEIFPVPRNIFPASLRRELLEKSLRHSGFLL